MPPVWASVTAETSCGRPSLFPFTWRFPQCAVITLWWLSWVRHELRDQSTASACISPPQQWLITCDIPNLCIGYVPGLWNSQNLCKTPHIKRVEFCVQALSLIKIHTDTSTQEWRMLCKDGPEFEWLKKTRRLVDVSVWDSHAISGQSNLMPNFLFTLTSEANSELTTERQGISDIIS